MEHLLRKASGPILALCTLLGACGGTPTPSQPGTELPTPTPVPTPTSAGFLHVLQQPYVVTYEIDAARGRLHPPVTQRIGDAEMLASDPRGRYVYAAHGQGAWCFPFDGRANLAIVAYAADARDGTLVQISDAPVRGGKWTWLSAGPDRVHGLVHGRKGWCSRSAYVYESVPVASDGRLGEVVGHGFALEEERGIVNVDVRTDMLYKAGRVADEGGLGGLAAHAIQPNGWLEQTGWTDLCVATTMPPFWMWSPEDEVPVPLVAVRGFLFAAVSLPPERRTVCSYQGQRLKPLADLGFNAYVAEVFVPSSESQPALVAMGVEVPAGMATRHELRLFSMSAAGDLQLLDSEDLLREVRKLAFHPSGRFLYVSDAADTLLGYAITPEGRLEPTESIDHAGGGMAITLPTAGS
jgi:6-phosphogluconolactonase (cycloisomerase 2 family)